MSSTNLHQFVEKSFLDIQEQFHIQYSKQLELHFKSITTELNSENYTPFYGKIESQHFWEPPNGCNSFSMPKHTFEKCNKLLQKDECVIIVFHMQYSSGNGTCSQAINRARAFTNFGNNFEACISNISNPCIGIRKSQLPNCVIDIIKNIWKAIYLCTCDSGRRNVYTNPAGKLCTNTEINCLNTSFFSNNVQFDLFTKTIEILINDTHTVYYKKFVQLKPYFDIQRDNESLSNQIKDMEKLYIDFKNFVKQENDKTTDKYISELAILHEQYKLIMIENDNLSEQVLFLKDKKSKVRNLILENDMLEKELSLVNEKLKQTISVSAECTITQQTTNEQHTSL